MVSSIASIAGTSICTVVDHAHKIVTILAFFVGFLGKRFNHGQVFFVYLVNHYPKLDIRLNGKIGISTAAKGKDGLEDLGIVDSIARNDHIKANPGSKFVSELLLERDQTQGQNLSLPVDIILRVPCAGVSTDGVLQTTRQ